MYSLRNMLQFDQTVVFTRPARIVSSNGCSNSSEVVRIHYKENLFKQQNRM